MEQNEYTMGSSTYTESYPNAYPGGNAFSGNNAAVQNVQDGMEIKSLLRKGNALRIATLVSVIIFGAASLFMQYINAYLIDDVRKDVNSARSDISDVSRNVRDIAGDVYDIMEQGCNGNNSSSYKEPYTEPDIEPYYPDYPEIEVEKPAIYLYPVNDSENVRVRLSLYRTDMLSTWPEPDHTYAYEYYWDVYADHDGTIYASDGAEYSYIFWEATDHGIHDFSKGFCVKGEDTADFLKETLSEIGLNSRELNDMIVYWLPRMQDNAYNLITFEGLEEGDAYNSFYGLDVTDSAGNEADSVLRVLMVWKSVDEYTDIEPQTFADFERNGFTVVEWGGAELND